MALGFGFNKAKVMASAEKYVQQGKLQNAITEYEKIVREDPKDLTILNTIGDLNARVGNNDNAAKYFQRVGEAYAQNGFTVKAIAMYKKLTKLNPSFIEGIQRLAELYTVQGLYNDARSQYVAVADYHLKNNNNDDAAKVFQKILELDPDNTAMQSKLADLYTKLGKKNEARNIYFTAAQSLYAKQAMDAADEALARVLKLDPKNVDALLLRGAIAAESGDGTGAIQYLKDIPDLDSRPDALRSMLRAQIQLKNLEEAGPLANKLVIVHNDLSGISLYADALLNANQFPEALAVYEQHADKVLASSGPALVKSLTGVITRVKESSAALESLRVLFRKAGEISYDAEIMELLAHAYVQDGNLLKAKDLYQELATNEPENPLHAQNYKQVIAKLGEDSTTKELTAEEGAQAFMIDEVDHKVPLVQQDYPADVAAAVQAALTDSELFDSYNLPAKALAPLEVGAKKAPRDLSLNQRLATVYAKLERYADAARCCNVLKEVFAEHGHETESQKYADMAVKYGAKAGASPETATMQEDTGSVTMLALDPAASEPVAAPEAFSASSVGELTFEAPAEPEPMVMEAAAVAEADLPSSASVSHDIPVDTDDWESMLSIEEPPPVAEVQGEVSVPPAAEPPHASAPEPGIETPVEAQSEAAATFELIAEEPDPAAPAVEEFSFESISASIESLVEPTIEVPVESTPIVVEPPPAPVIAAPLESPIPPVVPAPAPAPMQAAATSPIEEEDILGDLVSDLEDVLGDDFAFGAPEKPVAKAARIPESRPEPIPTPAPVMHTAPATVAPESVPPGFSSMGHEVPQEAPKIAEQEAVSVLSDLFDEFKEDAEASSIEAADPETHYNLGIAFKEMGLLDEAIGELQKVCHAVDQGIPFDQVIQAYTWLAQCLVDKEVPQAAVRWYEKALQVKNISEDSKLAIYYDLASAYEMAGNQRKAYETFMEVYSSNIDYRDVADRIKILKA